MSEINKTYRIKTDIGSLLESDYITIDANLVQDYDTFDILSVKIKSVDSYQLHNADYGVVVGRVLANNGFGIPNAKLSIFISSDSEDGEKIRELYPFTSIASRNSKGVRYNLLPDEMVDDCHQVVGTFPNKRYTLDDDVVLEVFDKYYKFTTRTNNSGDYLIMGVPVGTHNLHMDLDLSDCGVLSQRPRDFVYKGYTVEQFENPNQFKDGTDYENLSQIITQNQVVNVQPFWGNSSLGSQIGITRADINVAFKFEPTCVFMGSIVSDNSSQGISKKCIPTEGMGNMEELTTGEGTIEMIRKTMGGSIEELQIKGNQLINSNGIWCYQIPMNLDYMMTDEYGNMVPTDNPDIGIPTRACVRFRISMHDTDENLDNFFRAKALVPHNPQILEGTDYEDYDYEFGSKTRDTSFRDLFWNNVYSVKSYIPRFQKRKVSGWKEKKFTGIKSCNFFGSNNPFPYNNIRIKLPFMFTIMCVLIKIFILIIGIINTIIGIVGTILAEIGQIGFFKGKAWRWIGVDPWYPFKSVYANSKKLSLNVLHEGLCPDLENWFFAPQFKRALYSPSDYPEELGRYDLIKQTLDKIKESGSDSDTKSIDYNNNEENGDAEVVCLTMYTDYLLHCVEMNLAMEYRVINFDFYNDWINGTIYFPRFMRLVKPKKTFLGITFMRAKVKGCMDDTDIWSKSRRYTQQCSFPYKSKNVDGKTLYVDIKNPLSGKKNYKAANNLHKRRGFTQKAIFEKNGGICHEHTTLKGQHVYYMKPCEWVDHDKSKCTLFATDLILLGSLNNCDLYGIPQAFKYLSNTSYVMPTNLALTNMESSGPLYTNNGTVCDGVNGLSVDEVKNGARVDVLPPSCGMTAELYAFNDTFSDTYDTLYDKNEITDIIPLTEIAGISWSYTGPGQGEVDKDNLYYPGGHFLGLSCIHSESNIKSCINLTRICEVGANMSQRQEDVYKEKGEFKYVYTAPTGFISGSDIVGSDFRAMFATMNQKSLRATKVIKTNGYKMYDMTFVKPTNFNGAFSQITNGTNKPYNKSIEIKVEDPDDLNFFNISTSEDTSFDKDEYLKTQTRTIEDASIDYYRFRFGLEVSELTKNGGKQARKFLFKDGNEYYLPQYENSYYFYFGIKNGGTALDEFNKQFFSDCGNSVLVSSEPSITITGSENYDDIKDTNSNINIVVNNLEVPYKFIEIKSDVNFIGDDKTNQYTKNNLIIMNGDSETKYDSWLTSYNFLLSGCPIGTYTVTIRDASDITLTKTEKIGADFFKYEIDICNFNANVNKTVKNQKYEYTYEYGGEAIHKGGTINVYNISSKKLDLWLEKQENIKDFHLYIGVTKKTESSVLVNDPSYSELSSFNYMKERECTVNVNRPGVYNVYIAYNENGKANVVSFIDKNFDARVFIGEVEVKDTSYLGLEIGSSLNASASTPMTISKYGKKWWESKIVSGMSWFEESALFNTNVDNDKESFSIGVFPKEGTKVVWGLAQNSELGIDESKVYCTEYPEEIREGFVLDDEYVHYSTYNKEDDTVNCYSAIVYKNTDVMGGYYAYLSNGEIFYRDKDDDDNKYKTKWLKKTPEFISGCGYVFKPLPYGDLQFHLYDGKMADLYYDDMKNENGIATITNGLFYPSIPYHSFNRPFYVKANFYCWADTYIDIFFNENNQIDAKVTSREMTGKAEVSVYNGKTYYNQFHSASVISTLSYLTKFKVSENDCYGLKTGEDRVTVFSGYYAGGFDRAVEDITYHYYEITEGYSTKEGDKVHEMQCSKRAKTLSDGVLSNFVDSLSYTIIDGKVKPIFDSENNSKAKYFICNVFDNNDSFILSRNSKYIYGMNEDDPTNLYVLCTYTTSIGSYNKGSFNFLNICVDGGSKTIAFAYMSGDTSIVRNIGWFEKYCNSATSGVTNVEKNIKELISGVSAYVTIIKPVKQYSINTDLNNWADNIISNTKGGTLYYGVGVICGNTEDTKLFKIYPYVTECSSIPKLKSNFNIDGEKECTKELSCQKHNIDCELTVPTNLKWISSIDCNWIVISPNSGNNSSNIKIEVSENYGNTDREGLITFVIDGTEGDFYGELRYKITQLGNGGLSFIDSYGNFKTEMVIEKCYQTGEQTTWEENVYIKGIFEIEMFESDCITYKIFDGNYSDNEKTLVTFTIRTPNDDTKVEQNIRFYNQKEEINLTIIINNNCYE
jgi:hypothetical protein